MEDNNLEVKVGKLNEAYLKIHTDPSIEFELREYFSFDTPNKQFMPKYRSKMWDGKTRMYNMLTRALPAGLYLHLHQFCKERNYKIIKVPTDYGLPLQVHDTSFKAVVEFINKLEIKLPDDSTIRDYQVDAIYRAIRYQRRLFLSPTGSGKSLIIYCFLRYLQTITKKPLLLVVPTINLVNQMKSDFAEYAQGTNWDADKNCAMFYGSLSKDVAQQIHISTWQGIYSQPKQFFANYECIIGDEVHLWKAKSLVTIMQKCTETPWRIGTTGTLDNLETNKLTIEGHFGPSHVVATTKELIDLGYLSPLKIKVIVLEYPDEVRKANSKKDYQEELEWIISNEARNKFIIRLANSCSGNTLVLFQRIEKHGLVLHNQMQTMITNRTIHLVHGRIEAEERESIRKIAISSSNDIILGSLGTFALGVNVPNIRNIIFAHPSKTRIRNLQSIGRGLRLHKEKEYCTLYDIADDLSYEGKLNTTLEHFLVRINTYEGEKFDYNITKIPFKG